MRERNRVWKLSRTPSTVWFYNANGYEFMTLKSDDVSKRFESLFDERLVGMRHAEDGDRTREEPRAEKGDKEHDWNGLHVGDAGGFR